MKDKMFEMCGYVAIALTVFGQVVINISALGGQTIWMVANLLYLVKAFGQNLGKAEITRNFVMSGVTTGLIVLNVLHVF